MQVQLRRGHAAELRTDARGCDSGVGMQRCSGLNACTCESGQNACSDSGEGMQRSSERTLAMRLR
eukprot:4196246-Alexandrium_andersonii.AAC.1